MKLDFHKIEFQNNGKLLNISQIVINRNIYWPVFGHFDQTVDCGGEFVTVVSCGGGSL